MTRNVSIQTYLPRHVAAWVQDEASRAKQSRSQWIGAIVTDLFQGQELREEARQNAEFIKRRLVFIMCALDGLLLVAAEASKKKAMKALEPFQQRILNPLSHDPTTSLNEAEVVAAIKAVRDMVTALK